MTTTTESRPSTDTPPTPAPRARKFRIRSVGGMLGLTVVGIVFLLPFYWMFSSAFKPEGEIYRWPLQWIPSTIVFDHFARAWEAVPFAQFFINSLIVTAAGSTLKVLLAVFSAYAFAFLRFPGKKIVFLAVLGALMVPGHVTLLINYMTIGNLGLINTYAGIFLPGLASAFGTFLLRQHFLALPKEVLEAAELDGCGHVRRLVYFVLPISKPAVVTVALIAVIDEWNDFIWPLLVTNTLQARTLPIGLMFLKETEGVDQWGPIMAGTVLVILPMLLLFLIAQRYIVAGLAGAAVRR
ncbi:carbohydrate ABC transporter permease [Rhodococcus rhodochrous]|uniref:Carbohydrate ABC transporter permease n=1 Tax=Rhodococcus rhodochrous TaxID=1829 RepID=A0AA47AFU5_RHORH|nr:carbohydrate ABC transporter permease [Rhodococcus rhodochrous]MCB8914066.1 carbohydrate ABC transporter permease [Rhodococcus rhodochrous]UZF48007.1 carbohydrate ABC transporter permease [Rhodococcus rhodochrous]